MALFPVIIALCLILFDTVSTEELSSLKVDILTYLYTRIFYVFLFSQYYYINSFVYAVLFQRPFISSYFFLKACL